MSITLINATDLISTSRATINNNFTYLASLIGAGLSGSASLTFTSVPDGGWQDQTITIPGATTSPVLHVMLATPVPPNGVLFSAFVSAGNTVTVRMGNLSGAAVTFTGSFGAILF
jgi:hypothetical protein